MLTILASAHENFDEIYSSGYSNLTYLDVENRRLANAADVLAVSVPLTVERDMPICRMWQLGSHGRLELLAGDWDASLQDANSVLEAPSAPLTRTWPISSAAWSSSAGPAAVRVDLEAAWTLAQRYGEMIRVLPACAAHVEHVWLTGRDDERIAIGRELLSEGPRAGLEWARGDLAIWLRRLDPATEVPYLESLAEPYRLQLTGRHRAAAERWAALSAPYEQAMALVDTRDPADVRAGLDLLDRLGAGRGRGEGPPRAPEPRGRCRAVRRRSSTLDNTAGLTAREIEVLRLLELRAHQRRDGRAPVHPQDGRPSRFGDHLQAQVRNRREAGRVSRELKLSIEPRTGVPSARLRPDATPPV